VSPALRTGEVAHAAGLNLQTLRYYERRGLLPAPERSPGGHRLYSQDAVSLLQVIKAAQRLGFTLREVGELLEAGRRRHGRVGGRLDERAAAKLVEVEARIADLQVIRERLLAVLAAECDSLTDCSCGCDVALAFPDLAQPDDRHAAPAHAR
jgi:DNA-binding transcriptional MerR regulator